MGRAPSTLRPIGQFPPSMSLLDAHAHGRCRANCFPSALLCSSRLLAQRHAGLPNHLLPILNTVACVDNGSTFYSIVLGLVLTFLWYLSCVRSQCYVSIFCISHHLVSPPSILELRPLLYWSSALHCLRSNSLTPPS